MGRGSVLIADFASFEDLLAGQANVGSGQLEKLFLSGTTFRSSPFARSYAAPYCRERDVAIVDTEIVGIRQSRSL